MNHDAINKYKTCDIYLLKKGNDFYLWIEQYSVSSKYYQTKAPVLFKWILKTIKSK